MTPVPFPEVNVVLQKPKSMTDEECTPLPIYRGGGECISCWQLTTEELMEVLQSKRIWIRVLSGKSQPPIALETSSPFDPKTGEGS